MRERAHIGTGARRDDNIVLLVDIRDRGRLRWLFLDDLERLRLEVNAFGDTLGLWRQIFEVRVVVLRAVAD